MLRHRSSNPTFVTSMDNTTGPQLHVLATNCASWQETVSISDTVDALPDSVPSRDSESQSVEVSEGNEDRPGKRIALPKEQVTLQGITGADLRHNEVHASSGKKIAFPKEQVALRGIIRADLRPNEVHASSRVILPAGTNQAKVGRNQQQGLPDIQKSPQNGPAIEVIWKGNFKIHDCPSDIGQCEGIIAYPSAKVSRKAYSFAKQMAGNLHFAMYAQGQFCQDIFGMHIPYRDDIALYFYPGNYKRSRRQYSSLLKFIERMGLMLRGTMGDIELLVFPSKLLEVDSQKLGDSFFMWGVFRRIKGETSTSNAGAQTSPVAVS